MEISAYEFHYEPYHRVPMNSATTQKDWNELNSTGTHSTYSSGSRSTKPTMTTTYIDGITMLGQSDHRYSIKDLFPKGKGRQKPLHSSEKKNARDAYMSLLPPDASPIRSSSSKAQSSSLPAVPPKSASIRNKRLLRTTMFDDNSEARFFARCATTHANGAWVRRYKAINESQILSNFFLDRSSDEKLLLKKRPCEQLFVSSSVSFTPSLNKRRREKCN